MIIHEGPHEGAGKTYLLTDGTALTIRDYWDRGKPGGSWIDSAEENPAAHNYALHLLNTQLPLDDEVVYGNDPITGKGRLAHVTELGAVNPFDVRRAKATVAIIRANPERWDQSNWVTETECGTKFCAAGFIVARAGYQIDPETARVWLDAEHLDGRPPEYAGSLGRDVAVVARDLLGLQDHPAAAEALFAGMNSLEDLTEIIADYAVGKFTAHVHRIPGYDDPDEYDYDDYDDYDREDYYDEREWYYESGYADA